MASISAFVPIQVSDVLVKQRTMKSHSTSDFPSAVTPGSVRENPVFCLPALCVLQMAHISLGNCIDMILGISGWSAVAWRKIR